MYNCGDSFFNDILVLILCPCGDILPVPQENIEVEGLVWRVGVRIKIRKIFVLVEFLVKVQDLLTSSLEVNRNKNHKTTEL